MQRMCGLRNFLICSSLSLLLCQQLVAQKKPDDSQLQSGEIIGVWVQGRHHSVINHEFPPIVFNDAEMPMSGVPYLIEADGKLKLPLIKTLDTLSMSEKALKLAIQKAYVDEGVLPEKPFVKIWRWKQKIENNRGKLQVGDVLAIHINLLLQSDSQKIFYSPFTGLPAMGVPVQVWKSGIQLPALPKIQVVGKTVTEVKREIVRAYLDNSIYEKEEAIELHVSLLKKASKDFDDAKFFKLEPGDVVTLSMEYLTNSLEAIPCFMGSGKGTMPSHGVPFIVDQNGNISVPELGDVKVAGMTVEDCVAKVKGELVKEEILKDAASVTGGIARKDVEQARRKVKVGDVITFFTSSQIVKGMNAEREITRFGVPLEVNNDGKIYMPMLGFIEVSGKSPAEIQRFILKKYREEELILGNHDYFYFIIRKQKK